MTFKLPTIEEIYNEFHKQKFFFQRGFYPKTIVNYDNLYSDKKKVEIIKYFILYLERNRNSVDWRKYIFALAKVLRGKLELKHLGSFRPEIESIEIM